MANEMQRNGPDFSATTYLEARARGVLYERVKGERFLRQYRVETGGIIIQSALCPAIGIADYVSDGGARAQANVDTR